MLKHFGFHRIDRLSLLRQANLLVALIVAILGLVLSQFTNHLNHLPQLAGIFAVALPAAVWVLNRWALPAAARKQRFFLFASVSVGVLFYVALAGIRFNGQGLEPQLIYPLAGPIVIFFFGFPLLGPAYLALSLSLGGLLSFLYRRRDYLPEAL